MMVYYSRGKNILSMWFIIARTTAVTKQSNFNKLTKNVYMCGRCSYTRKRSKASGVAWLLHMLPPRCPRTRSLLHTQCVWCCGSPTVRWGGPAGETLLSCEPEQRGIQRFDHQHFKTRLEMMATQRITLKRVLLRVNTATGQVREWGWLVFGCCSLGI